MQKQKVFITLIFYDSKDNEALQLVNTKRFWPTDPGSRVSVIMSRRRQVLVEVHNRGLGTSCKGDLESAEMELGRWLHWESFGDPAQEIDPTETCSLYL